MDAFLGCRSSRSEVVRLLLQLDGGTVREVLQVAHDVGSECRPILSTGWAKSINPLLRHEVKPRASRAKAKAKPGKAKAKAPTSSKKAAKKKRAVADVVVDRRRPADRPGDGPPPDSRGGHQALRGEEAAMLVSIANVSLSSSTISAADCRGRRDLLDGVLHETGVPSA